MHKLHKGQKGKTGTSSLKEELLNEARFEMGLDLQEM